MLLIAEEFRPGQPPTAEFLEKALGMLRDEQVDLV
jgi:hypothetical protein